ncbi:unnamed protein product [Rangifer tarandus platyrhynchus]|uniref:Uncharacterized protein n=2 Tax=Rangifer tarandus platyrhynchus TaxID=3082113 RepID=A0ACB0F2C0_RANTA|nr:unnamed protein product [Rangifer tarandus platyrhynchus]CAI9706281.1 unnamed protein product [Rangifer tarandus platyrhynchus]
MASSCLKNCLCCEGPEVECVHLSEVKQGFVPAWLFAGRPGSPTRRFAPRPPVGGATWRSFYAGNFQAAAARQLWPLYAKEVGVPGRGSCVLQSFLISLPKVEGELCAPKGLT